MKLLKEFKDYLKNKKLSKASVKNYISDGRQFLQWSAKNNFSNLTPLAFSSYKTYLIDQKTPTKSINRYLSSLRTLGQFLKEEKLMMINPAESLENIKEGQGRAFTLKKKTSGGGIKEKFRQTLIGQHLKPATIKNYVSDVGQFLNWLKEKD